MRFVLANARPSSASVSTTWFLSPCRQSTYDVTSVYWDSRAQDTSTSIEVLRSTPFVVTDARR